MEASKKNTRSKNKSMAEQFLRAIDAGGAEMINGVLKHYGEAGHIINAKKYDKIAFLQMSDASVVFFCKTEVGNDVGCLNANSVLHILNDQYPFTKLEKSLKHHNT